MITLIVVNLVFMLVILFLNVLVKVQKKVIEELEEYIEFTEFELECSRKQVQRLKDNV